MHLSDMHLSGVQCIALRLNQNEHAVDGCRNAVVVMVSWRDYHMHGHCVHRCCYFT